MQSLTPLSNTDLAQEEAEVLGNTSPAEMFEHQRWLEKYGTPKFKANLSRICQTDLRRLNSTEITRLEEVISNEAKCAANGRTFSEWELEQEGRWIMGCSVFRQSYLETAAPAIL
ncbi:hypothetical protein [Ralstonia pseudosolanacearum]|uniref:hypothetical protein n=1 Tax=Ralstonia pseudosolanacearum TaxID=1310165 RepID=UPI003CF7A106